MFLLAKLAGVWSLQQWLYSLAHCSFEFILSWFVESVESSGWSVQPLLICCIRDNLEYAAIAWALSLECAALGVKSFTWKWTSEACFPGVMHPLLGRETWKLESEACVAGVCSLCVGVMNRTWEWSNAMNIGNLNGGNLVFFAWMCTYLGVGALVFVLQVCGTSEGKAAVTV